MPYCLTTGSPTVGSKIESKPYKAGLQKSFAFEVMRREPDGLYDVLAASYDALLADGRRVDGEESDALS